MKINTHKVDLNSWIRWATTGSQTVVEFGAMFFDKLACVAAPKKIGIEIWEPYIRDAKYHECQKIHGDFTIFESLIEDKDLDCAMFIDTLEHINREDAFELMSRVMNKFNKVILMIPEGNHPMDEDVTGYEAHTYQTHRSTWYAKDLIDLGFLEEKITLDPTFHSTEGRDTGCLFAVWSK
jgi:hypothetical protein